MRSLARLALVALFSVALFRPLAPPAEDPALPAPPGLPAGGALELIARRLAAGEIDYSTALRYRILWFKRRDLLPEELRAAGDGAVRCASPVVVEIIQNFDRLRDADRRWLAETAGLPDLPAILVRPAYAYTIVSSLYPLEVHYETSEQAEVAATTLGVYEHSWQRECGEMGFFQPPADYGLGGNDNFDVYISSDMPSTWWGYTAHDQPVDETWWNDWTSYIAHNATLTALSAISATGCHEFNHACQAAMAAEETASIWENTAEWIIPHVYFEYASTPWGMTYAFQRDPWRAVCAYDDGGGYQYGGMMWPEYLEERFGGWAPDLMAQVWDWCRDTPGGNAHNYFDAFVHVAETHEPGGPGGDGWTIRDLIMDLSEWRYFCGSSLADGAHYTYGEHFNAVTVDVELRHTSLPAFSPAELPDPPQFFGVNYARFDEALVGETNLKVYFHGEEEHYGEPLIWKLAILKYYTLGGDFSYQVYDVPQDTQTLLLEVEEANLCERLVMVVANLGAGSPPPAGSFPAKGYAYAVGDAGDPPLARLLAAPGPAPDNPEVFRSFLAANPATSFGETVHSAEHGHGLNLAAGDIDGDGVDEVVAGCGPDPDAPPLFRGYELNGEPIAGTQRQAYGVSRYGVNVACGDIDGDGFSEIVTGAGPGAVFGPQVRGWDFDGSGATTPIPGVNFFAYGTLRYGVNVACGDIDGDGFAEIVTGAGPGAVFGPHVRGFDHDGGPGTTPIPGVSFFAYGTPRWGVNVACGDLDGDGCDEILTGPGPGAVYGPQVRGWKFDGAAVTPLAGVNFLAYGTNRWGVRVAAGDVDLDRVDEIVTSPGPGPEFGAHLRGWSYDGEGITPVAAINFFAFPPGGSEPLRHGARLAVADRLGGE